MFKADSAKLNRITLNYALLLTTLFPDPIWLDKLLTRCSKNLVFHLPVTDAM